MGSVDRSFSGRGRTFWCSLEADSTKIIGQQFAEQLCILNQSNLSQSIDQNNSLGLFNTHRINPANDRDRLFFKIQMAGISKSRDSFLRFAKTSKRAEQCRVIERTFQSQEKDGGRAPHKLGPQLLQVLSPRLLLRLLNGRFSRRRRRRCRRYRGRAGGAAHCPLCPCRGRSRRRLSGAWLPRQGSRV